MSVTVLKQNFNHKFHVVQCGETLEDIAKNYKIPVSYIQKQNNIETEEDFYVGKILYFEKVGYTIHVVKPRETLESICLNYGVDKEYLIKKNKITRLFIGQQLEI